MTSDWVDREKGRLGWRLGRAFGWITISSDKFWRLDLKPTYGTFATFIGADFGITFELLPAPDFVHLNVARNHSHKVPQIK